MKTFLLAARMYSGYKLKALSLLVFITVGLGIVMLGVDALYNSFNLFFDRPASYFLPRYFVAKKAGFDIIESDYSIADLALKEDQRSALAERLGTRFELHDTAYFWSLFKSRRVEGRGFYALVVGLDFNELGRAFPFFEGALSEEEISAFKAEPLVMVESRLAKRASIKVGEEYSLLSTDYFKDYNGIKVKVRAIKNTPQDEDDSLTIPIVYIDLKHIRRLLAIPSGIGLPYLISPKRPAHALSLDDASDMAAIRSAAEPLGLQAYSVSTVSEGLRKTYGLYRGVMALLSAFLVLVMMAAVSANLAINFQNRRADFGLMKAFGCSDRRLLGLVAAENALGLALPFALACAANLAAGLLVRPFKVLGNFTIIPRASAPGLLVILAASIAIWAVSSIKPYRYLKRVDPVSIMREE
jgi:ABC-type lipoprotein release transport system permease subunit